MARTLSLSDLLKVWKSRPDSEFMARSRFSDVAPRADTSVR